MNKLILQVCILINTSFAFSQVLFFENFNNISGPTAGGAGTYTFPTGWIKCNVDNRTPNAAVSYVNEAWERREDFAGNIADSCAFSTSYYAPVDAADDWMWTPQIANLPLNTVLSWRSKAYDPAFPDGFEVRIMTASSTPGGPTGTTGIMGNQLTNSTQLFSTTAENSSWTIHTVNLNAYAGESVRIAFRNNSNDKFILVVDDIKLEVQINNDASLTSVSPTNEYTITPITQVQPITFGGTIQNAGILALTNVQLNVDVTNSLGATVFSGTSAGANLASGANTIFTLSSDFTPSTADTYHIVSYPSATENDQLTSNDTIYSTLIISDSIYARDNGNAVGSLGIGAGNGGYLGNQFEVANADELTSITMKFQSGYVGRKFAAVIWDMAGGMPNSIIAGTDTLIYPDNLGGIFTIPVQGFPTLPAGEYVVTAVEFVSDSTIALAQTSEIFTSGKTWVDWPTNPLGDWANNEDFGGGFSKSYYLRANFGSTCLPNITTNTTSICFGESVTVGVNTYSVTGNYSDTMNVSGCDSIVHTHLTVADEIDVTTSLSNTNLTIDAASIVGATYQWIDCTDDSFVTNETSSSITPSVTGDYAVIITVNNCSDTSDCTNINTSGINELSAKSFAIYPNPTHNEFKIQSSIGGNFVLRNELGQKILSFELLSFEEKSISVAKLQPGIYFIVNNENGSTQKLVIQ